MTDLTKSKLKLMQVADEQLARLLVIAVAGTKPRASTARSDGLYRRGEVCGMIGEDAEVGCQTYGCRRVVRAGGL